MLYKINREEGTFEGRHFSIMLVSTCQIRCDVQNELSQALELCPIYGRDASLAILMCIPNLAVLGLCHIPNVPWFMTPLIMIIALDPSSLYQYYRSTFSASRISYHSSQLGSWWTKRSPSHKRMAICRGYDVSVPRPSCKMTARHWPSSWTYDIANELEDQLRQETSTHDAEKEKNENGEEWKIVGWRNVGLGEWRLEDRLSLSQRTLAKSACP
jgi:hypothetical protein